jgi:plasmid stabilization system protein ParE
VNVRLLGAALAEALEIADLYEQQTPGLGDRFLAALDALVANIMAHPRMYGRVRRAPAGREIREAMIRGFPFIVVYEVTPNEAVILSVTHARRANRSWRQRLPDPPTS